MLNILLMVVYDVLTGCCSLTVLSICVLYCMYALTMCCCAVSEPSSGMDPLSRRHMWDVIATVSGDRSVILTTHSMEVLCSV